MWVGLYEPLTLTLRRKKPAYYSMSLADSKLMAAFNMSYL